MRQGWLDFWFKPSSPSDLGICRVIYYGALVYFFWDLNLSGWSGVSAVFWMPIPLFRDLHIPVLSSGLLAILQNVWKVALTCSCIGLFTRVSTWVSFVLGVYILGLPHNFGKAHHGDAIVVLITGILALSRCGDGWSVDQLIRNLRRKIAPETTQTVSSAEYRWPVRLAQGVVVFVFFGAGVSKLRHSGLQWILSDNLQFVLLERNRPWGLRVAQYSWLCKALAGSSLVAEVSVPLVFVSRVAQVVLIPSLFLMQVGIYVMMFNAFHQFMIAYVFWVPWERLGHGVAVALRGAPRPVSTVILTVKTFGKLSSRAVKPISSVAKEIVAP